MGARWGFLIVGVAGFLSSASSATTITFSSQVFSQLNVPTAGTIVSGTLRFDPSTTSQSSCGPHCADYVIKSGTFSYTTNGGFSLTQPLTAFNVSDRFANGIADYYVFDADYGTFGSTTFRRLELGFSHNNGQVTIPDTSIPQSIDLSDFQFKIADYFVFDSAGKLTNRIISNVTDISVSAAVPEPSTWAMLIIGFAGMGFMAHRRCIGQEAQGHRRQARRIWQRGRLLATR